MGAPHLEGLIDGHRLAGDVAQCEVDGFLLGVYSEAGHYPGDQFVVDV